MEALMADTPTNKSDLQDILQTKWSNILYDDLIAQRKLFTLLRSEYEGDIKEVDDKVVVNYVKTAVGQELTGDQRSFEAEEMVVGKYEIAANKIAIASFDLPNLKRLESPEFVLKMQKALREGIELKIEAGVIAMLTGATYPAGHALQTATTDLLDDKDIGRIRAALSKKHVPKEERYCFGDVDFTQLLIDTNKLTSRDFSSNNSSDDASIRKVQGFIYDEHDYLPAKTLLAFHRSAAHVVMGSEVVFKISDQHANKKLGYVVSAHVIWGSKVFDNNRIAKMVNKPA